MKKKWFAIGLSLALTAQPAQACWSDTAYAAAQVREFETMLMVSALRCRGGETNFLKDYNQFVRTSRGALSEVNDTLRDHFAQDVGRKASLDAYDSFVTRIANRYGAGLAGVGCADLAWITHAAVATGGSADALVELARNAGTAPILPGGERCEPTAASLVIAAR